MKTSGMTRALYDCPAVPLTPGGPVVRLLVATHAVTSSPPKIGVERDGTVYELFVSTLPSPAFASSDVLDLYLHRGSFETVLFDEDVEQDSDRWYSHASCGQEFCQILAQWVWNLRLELGQKLSSSGLRTTEFAKAEVVEPAPAIESAPAVEPAPSEKQIPQVKSGPPQWALLPSREAFLVQLSSRNRMGRCAAPPIIHSIHKNADQSEMAPFVSCMPLALVIVEPALCAYSVKKAAPRSSHGG
jgi:hypothetical protein